MSRRFLNCARNYASWSTSKPERSPLMKTLMNDFDYYTPKIIDNALEKIPFILNEDIRNRVKRASEYYTIGRNPVQGEFMVFAFEALNDGKKVTDEIIHQLQVVLATVEIVNSYFFIYDDLEDDAKIRVGRTCWHLVDNNGMLAFNDACIMRSFTEEIIKQNFKGELRENILSIYHKIYFMCSLGQYVQATVSRSKNYNNFTRQTYDTINILKSSTYSVAMPILLGLALNNKLNQESSKIVDNVSLDIGIVVQVHNDLIDYYHGKGIVKGKTGHDIQEGNCSWIAIGCLESCNPAQRKIFTENYGSWDPVKVKRIQDLYEEMNVEEIYKREKKKRIDQFKKKVESLPENCTPSAEFFKRFYDLFDAYSDDTKNLMYDKQ